MSLFDRSSVGLAMDLDEQEAPLARLIRAWTNERHSPDLLVFQGDLLDGLLQKLHEQSLMVSHLESDPSITESEYLSVQIVKADMERLKFIVRSYVRVRLHKIEKYAPFIMATESMQEKLSAAELTHAHRYQKLLATHYHSTALDPLPEVMHALDQTFPDGSSMISRPDKDQAVFIHARVACPHVLLPDGDHIDIALGAIHLMRYSTIEHLLARGEVNLI